MFFGCVRKKGRVTNLTIYGKIVSSIKKQKIMQIKKINKQLLSRLKLGLSAIALMSILAGAAAVHADQFDAQINALNNKNAAARGAIGSLAATASSYQDKISQLQTQISSVESVLSQSLARQAALQTQINETKAKIDLQKQYLGEDIKAMYVDGGLTTIEALATSNNLSEYVDKETYRTAVQNKIDESIKQIQIQQAALQRQKAELDGLVAAQQQQQQQLAGMRNEQQSLLSYNQSQQAGFNQQISVNNAQIANLRRQQIAANSRFVGSYSPGSGPTCGGGYPGYLCNAAMDSIIDPWGMYNRECVSYTAYKVHADFLAGRNSRDMPYWGGRGNANQWDDNARAIGLRVDRSPEPGAIAVSNSGYYGHVMYVESVNGDGTFNISQYNASWDGRYSVRYNVSVGNLVFIHF